MATFEFVVREAQEKKEDPIQRVEFYLARSTDGHIYLLAKDSHGVSWFVLSLSPGKAVTLYDGIPERVGLARDSTGRVKITPIYGGVLGR